MFFYSNNTNPARLTFHPERYEQRPDGGWDYYPAWTEQHADEDVWLRGRREWEERQRQWEREYQGQWVQPEPEIPDRIGPTEAMELLEKLGKGEWPFGKIEIYKKGEQLEFDFVRQMNV